MHEDVAPLPALVADEFLAVKYAEPVPLPDVVEHGSRVFNDDGLKALRPEPYAERWLNETGQKLMRGIDMSGTPAWLTAQRNAEMQMAAQQQAQEHLARAFIAGLPPICHECNTRAGHHVTCSQCPRCDVCGQIAALHVDGCPYKADPARADPRPAMCPKDQLHILPQEVRGERACDRYRGLSGLRFIQLHGTIDDYDRDALRYLVQSVLKPMAADGTTTVVHHTSLSALFKE